MGNNLFIAYMMMFCYVWNFFMENFLSTAIVFIALKSIRSGCVYVPLNLIPFFFSLVNLFLIIWLINFYLNIYFIKDFSSLYVSVVQMSRTRICLLQMCECVCVSRVHAFGGSFITQRERHILILNFLSYYIKFALLKIDLVLLRL